MLTNARILMDINDQMILNEEEKLRLLEEIDLDAIELIKKRQQLAEMTSGVESKKAKYKDLKREIKQLDEKAHYLNFMLKEKEDELDSIKQDIAMKDIELESLSKETGIKPPDFSDPAKKQQQKRNNPKQLYYRPIMGDLVDETLSIHLNEAECRLPIVRLVDGFYLFGTTKIFMKMMGGGLVVKNGPAYIRLEEFMALKVEAEMAKIDELIQKKEWD